MTVTKGVRRILAMKMLLNIFEGILMASLTLIVPEGMVAALAALSAFHLYRGLSVACFYKNMPKPGDEPDGDAEYPARIGGEKRPAVEIEYEDTGQKYMYVIRTEENAVRCFSDNKYMNPDDLTEIVRAVEEDGKISAEDNSEVDIEIRKMR